MHVDLAHWLTEHRSSLLLRWKSLDYAASEGSANGHSIVQPIAPHDTVQDTHGDILTNIYDTLIQATQDAVPAIDSYLTLAATLNQWKNINFPDLLGMILRLRRLIYEIIQQEQPDPTQFFALITRLDTHIEHAVDVLAHLWDTYTEAKIQERISQAEFIAESLASATEEADRRALQLSALNQISQRLSSSLENDDLLNLVGTSLLDILGVSHIAIWLPLETDNDGEYDPSMLYVAQTWGQDTHSIIGMGIGDCVQDIVVRAHTEARMIYDPAPDPICQGAWYQAGCVVLALPLLVNERSTGVITLQDPQPSVRLARSQHDLARGIATQTAIALENARLYARIRRFNNALEQLVAERTRELLAEKDRLRTLYDITKEVGSTLDLDALLDMSLTALARITHAEFGSVMLVEHDTDHLVSRASLGKTESVFTRFPIGVGIAGWVAEHKEPVLIPDVKTDSRWMALPADEHRGKREGSMVAVPLMAQNEVLGVLTLSHQQTGFFNEDHLRLISASAGGIAVGIHNANLYNTIVAETERRGELLRLQQETTGKLSAILQSLSDGVLVCDPDGRVLSTNAAAGRILQRSVEELVLWNLHDLLPRYLADKASEMPLSELLSRPLDQNQEPRMFKCTAELGTRVISLTMGPVLREEDGELIGALLVLRDITREIESDRLKTEFIGTMSHELRTPMTAIKGFTQLLAMGSIGQINDTQRELLITIQTNAERMIAIINDVLDITKIETGSIDLELRPLHLAEVFSGVIADLQGLLRDRHHELTVSIPPGLLLVRADSARLHQILYNILSNAAKYTPCGGQIEISANEAHLSEIPEAVCERVPGDRRYVQINVRDTGVGIAPEEHDRIFERFYRTENPLKVEAGGTGLGLSLVKPLVELLGGQIWVQSALNEGSTFSFILPAVT